MSFLKELFNTEKPIIGLLHLKPLPGDPLYYPGGTITTVSDAAKRDLEALQQGGVDGILVTNEFSMPYQKHVSAVTLAAMGRVIGLLSDEISLPWGAEVIYDGDATIELCAAVEAQFTRCMFTGAWAGDFGLIDRDFSHTMRLKSSYRLDNLKMFHFVTSEGEVYLNDRSTSEIADSIRFNCLPDALVVGGEAAGRGPSEDSVASVRDVAPDVPILCGTGCRRETIRGVLSCCDGAFVGTCLKRDGLFSSPVDRKRVVSFMEEARAARE